MVVRESLTERSEASMATESGPVAPAELIVNGEYSDERFIDMMAAHHRLAIEVARIGQENGEHQEIRQLAEGIISTQQDEIERLSAIKEREFGSPEVATRMNPQQPSMFAMAPPDQLAGQRPFDLAFIDSNVPHHASAVEKAAIAYRQSENEEIKGLAREIIDTQSKEAGQMIGWRQEWYPEEG